MHSQRWDLGNRAILVLTLLILLGCWLGAASGQNSTNSASVAKPALPDSTDPAKSGQPAAPDTSPPRVANVQPDSFVIGVEHVLNINVWTEPEMSRVSLFQY